MQIHRIDYSSFAQIVLWEPKWYGLGDRKVRSIPNTVNIPNMTHNIFQCESPRVAERILRSHDDNKHLKYMPESLFTVAIRSFDYSKFDLGPALWFERLPEWHKLRPWLQSNMMGDITATIASGGKGKRLSFANPEDYILMKLTHQ
jgi:hypothetical protein